MLQRIPVMFNRNMELSTFFFHCFSFSLRFFLFCFINSISFYLVSVGFFALFVWQRLPQLEKSAIHIGKWPNKSKNENTQQQFNKHANITDWYRIFCKFDVLTFRICLSSIPFFLSDAFSFIIVCIFFDCLVLIVFFVSFFQHHVFLVASVTCTPAVTKHAQSAISAVQKW